MNDPIVLLSWDCPPLHVTSVGFEFEPLEGDSENVEEWSKGYGLYITITDMMLEGVKPKGWSFPNAIEGVKVDLSEIDNKAEIASAIIVPTIDEAITKLTRPRQLSATESRNFSRLTKRLGVDYFEEIDPRIRYYNMKVFEEIRDAWGVISDVSDTLPSLVRDLWMLRKGENGYYLESLYEYIDNLKQAAYKSESRGERAVMESMKSKSLEKEVNELRALTKQQNEEINRLQKMFNDSISLRKRPRELEESKKSKRGPPGIERLPKFQFKK